MESTSPERRDLLRGRAFAFTELAAVTLARLALLLAFVLDKFDSLQVETLSRDRR
jgi:hypothetical protein